MFLQSVYKDASDALAFVVDVKPLNETSIKHNRINVPDDHVSETSGPTGFGLQRNNSTNLN